MLRLKKLRAKSCRGIVDGPDLNFEPGGLLLCGSNGTGKSSFVDAIEKVLTGKCSSLDTGDQSLSWAKHGAHVDSTTRRADITLTLTDGNKSIDVTLDTDASALDKQTQTFLTAAKQQSFILRRRTLLNFIDAKPKDRYKAIEAFLNLDQYAAFEALLKQMVCDIEKQIRKLEDDRSLHETELRVRLILKPVEQVNVTKCVEHVNTLLVDSGLGSIVSAEEIPARLSEINFLLANHGDVNTLLRSKSLMEGIQEIPNASEVLTTGNVYAKARKAFLDKEMALKGHFYTDVLEKTDVLRKGAAWIEKDSLEHCPLCNNPINLEDVIKHVKKRISENQSLTQAGSSQENARKAFTNALTKHIDALRKVKDRWPNNVGSEFPTKADDALNILVHLERSHAESLPGEAVIKDINDLAKYDLDKIIGVLRTELEEKISAFSGSETYTALFTLKKVLETVCLHLQGITNANSNLKHKEMVLHQSKHIADLAEQGRKQAVQKLLAKIETTADGYFQELHPNESIGSPTLEVKQSGSGSIVLKSVFYEQVGDPRGHYSEGHVDSLALCLFLAIRRLHHDQQPALSLLVLDDVLHSVDGDHRLATARLIFKEFNDHQIIVTTHDPIWFKNLKKISRKYQLNKRRFEYRRIASWTRERGPIWGDHLSDYESLTSPKALELTPANRAIKAGRLLEEILQNLCHNLCVSVPYNIRNEYTLNPLWTSFFSYARKYDVFYAKASWILNTIDDVKEQRNWIGAHSNSWAAQLTDSESQEFADAVVALRNHVYCTQCDRFIKRIQDLDGIWSCKCRQKSFDRKLQHAKEH